MSKLKITSIFILAVATLMALPYGASKYWGSQKSNLSTQRFPAQLLSEETRLWGKAVGPIQLRLEFKEQKGNHVVLEGHIRSTLKNFEITWKLPEGVKLVDGQLNEPIQQASSDPTEHRREIVVDVTWPLENPHLVLRAAESSNADAVGASTVFNLDPSLEEMEKEEIIRAHMQSRRLQKLVK